MIDECHRGSAAEDSAWREILDYFSVRHADRPHRHAEGDRSTSPTSHYFGEPVYSYSLKQGIRDGFLAPYKVVKVHIDRDVEGYRPEKGQLDRDGEEVEDRIYNTEGLRPHAGPRRPHQAGRPARSPSSSRRAATASRRPSSSASIRSTPRACARRSSTRTPISSRENHRYVMRITGSDTEGQAQLGNFIDPEVEVSRCSSPPRACSRPASMRRPAG